MTASPRPHPAIETAFVPPQAVLYDDRNATVYELSPSASAVWLLLDGTTTVPTMAEELAEIVGRPADAIAADVEVAIAEFAAQGLLDLADEDPRAAAPSDDAAIPDRRYALPPGPGCGCGDNEPTWAGQVDLRVGDALLGVRYDTEGCGEALRRELAGHLDLGDPAARPAPVAAVLGVRTAKVGIRRRRVGLVYVGSNLRHRCDSLDDAIGRLREILGGIDRQLEPGEVALDLRLYARATKAVMVDAVANLDIDERPLRRGGISAIATWRAVVDPERATVRIDGRRVELVGVIVAGVLANAALDSQREMLWARATDGDRKAWAWMLDRWTTDQIVPAAADPAGAIVAALG